MGPLAGVKVLELEAIGPGPFCAMMLADMGADVLLVDRPSDPRLGFDRDRRFDAMLRGRRSVTLDLKSPDGVAAALALVERADALIEGFRPGVMERLGLGPERAPRAQPEARLRPDDRLGPGRAARGARRPRHQLHRADGRPARDRARGRRAGAAAQPGRRLRRRRDAARLRHRVRAARSAALGPGTGRRRGDGGRRLAARDDVLRACSPRGAGARSAARTCSTPARPGTTPTRRGTAGSSPSARSSRSSTRSCSRASASRAEMLPEQHDRARLAGAAAPLRGSLPREDARRVVRGVRGLGRLLRAGAHVLRGARASPQPRASRLRDGRRRAAAGTRAALLAHAGRRAPRARPSAARRDGRPWPSGGSRTPKSSDSRRSASGSRPDWFSRHEGPHPLVLPDVRKTAAFGSDLPSAHAAFFAQRSSSSQPPMRLPLTKTCGTVCALAIAPTTRLRTLWSSGTST